jgi:SAM-dependent methyltransferase
VANISSGASGVPLSHLSADEKEERSGSFGEVAAHYERFRPGPSAMAVDWLLPDHVGLVVDLGAGTGAMTRHLIARANEVVAVEPDDRMRAVLMEEVPAARAVMGRGEAIPLPEGCADAVLASSSWHWMDPIPTLHEVGRVLKPNGILGAVWSGPDPDGQFMVQAQSLLAEQSRGTDSGQDDNVTGLILGDALRPVSTLEIPQGVPFDQPEHESFTWDVALDADELIGLLGTLSWIITMPEETRRAVFEEARRLLRDLLGIAGDVTVDVAFRSDVWRTVRRGSIV